MRRRCPLAAVKASGYGRFGGKAGMEQFTETRWITHPDHAAALSVLKCARLTPRKTGDARRDRGCGENWRRKPRQGLRGFQNQPCSGHIVGVQCRVALVLLCRIAKQFHVRPPSGSASAVTVTSWLGPARAAPARVR